MTSRRSRLATTRRLLALCLIALGAILVASPTALAATNCDGEEATAVYGNGDDSIAGTAEDDVIVAGGGNDFIDALAGDDRVCAGSGEDLVVGGLDNDRLFGEDGDDGVRGDEGDDLISGGPGNDRPTETLAAQPAADESGLPFGGFDVPTFLVLGLLLVGTWLLVSAGVRFRRRRAVRQSA